MNSFLSQWSSQLQDPQTPSSDPVLPIPVCTSSAMNKTSYCEHKAFAFFKNFSSGVLTPASPWIGSTRNPATLEFVFNSDSNDSKSL